MGAWGWCDSTHAGLNERLGLFELHGLRANGWVVKAMYWLLNLIDVGVTVARTQG